MWRFTDLYPDMPFFGAAWLVCSKNDSKKNMP